MASTLITDIWQGRPMLDYVNLKSNQLSALIQSGIVYSDASIMAAANSGGSFVDMPHWNRLTGEDEVVTDSTSLTPEKITAGSVVATKCFRGKAWSANEMAGLIAGSDPVGAIAEKVAVFKAEKLQKALLAVLKGTMLELAGSHVLDVTGALGVLEADTILDAKQLLGDAAGKLTAIAMHSAKYTDLQKANLIAYIPNARGEVNIPTYLGYRVIVDDAMPQSAGNYTSYLFAAGSIAMPEVEVATPFETSRDAAAGVDNLFYRWAFVPHVRGVSYTGAFNPSNAVLETDVWSKVYENKDIGVVALVTK